MAGDRSTPEEAAAVAEILRRHWRVRPLVQDLPLEQVALDVGGRLQAVRRDPALFRRWPPFVLAELVELCAVHSRIVGTRPIPQAEFERALDALRPGDDPVAGLLLARPCGLAFFSMHAWRRQIAMQFAASTRKIGRALRLMWDRAPFARTERALVARFGFDLTDWLVACLSAWSITSDKPGPSVTAASLSLLPSGLIEPGRLRSCLDLLAYDQRGLAARYLETHHPSRVLDWETAAPALLDRPLVRFDRGYIAPLPDLLVRAAVHRGCELAAEADRDAAVEELGASLQRYAGELFERVPGVLDRRGPRQLEAASEGGEACDYAFEFPRSVLLVECKATQIRRERFTDRAWKNASEAGQVAKAFSQLHATADRVHRQSGLLAGFGAGKPLLGVVVTLGEFPGANMDEFRAAYIEPRMRPPAGERPGWPAPLRGPPQVLSLDALDGLAVWLAATGRDPLELFDEKAATREVSTGDWDLFIERRIEGQPNPLAEFWEGPFESLWASRVRPFLGGSSES